MSANQVIDELAQVLADVGEIKTLVDRYAVRHVQSESMSRLAYLKRRIASGEVPPDKAEQAAKWAVRLEGVIETSDKMLREAI